MAKRKTDAEAMAELREWCRPLGLKAVASPCAVRVVWKDPFAKSSDLPYAVVSAERRTRPGWDDTLSYARKRQSVASACSRVIDFFKRGGSVHWARTRFRDVGPCRLETEETVQIALPASGSPSELELKLAAMGWTGNPFGESAELNG